MSHFENPELDPITLKWLASMGLTLTPHSNPLVGWGYVSDEHPWVGPFPTVASALQAAFSNALLALHFSRASSSFAQAQRGDLLRYNAERPGDADGWEPVNGSSAQEEDCEAYTALTTLLLALGDLRRLQAGNLGTSEREKFQQTLERAWREHSHLEGLLQAWEGELEDRVMQDDALDESDLDDEDLDGEQEDGPDDE